MSSSNGKVMIEILTPPSCNDDNFERNLVPFLTLRMICTANDSLLEKIIPWEFVITQI